MKCLHLDKYFTAFITIPKVPSNKYEVIDVQKKASYLFQFSNNSSNAVEWQLSKTQWDKRVSRYLNIPIKDVANLVLLSNSGG